MKFTAKPDKRNTSNGMTPNKSIRRSAGGQTPKKINKGRGK